MAHIPATYQKKLLSLPTDFTLAIRQMPTISPKDGLPMHVHARADVPAAPVSAAA